jgi:hypothetical protein
MTFFEGWVNLFKNKKENKELKAWARIEYKYDAEYAYHHMITHGFAPSIGVKL